MQSSHTTTQIQPQNVYSSQHTMNSLDRQDFRLFLTWNSTMKFERPFFVLFIRRHSYLCGTIGNSVRLHDIDSTVEALLMSATLCKHDLKKIVRVGAAYIFDTIYS